MSQFPFFRLQLRSVIDVVLSAKCSEFCYRDVSVNKLNVNNVRVSHIYFIHVKIVKFFIKINLFWKQSFVVCREKHEAKI